MYQHLTHFEQPELQVRARRHRSGFAPTTARGSQTYIVRILWMVPIYGVESWFSLRYLSVSIYMSTLREWYEAYVIFSFLSFLIAYMGGEEELVRKLATKAQSRARHIAPFCCFRDWRMGREFLVKIKVGTLQYVVAKFVTSVITFACQSADVYDEGNFSFTRGYVYCTIINNASQTVSRGDWAGPASRAAPPCR